MPFIGFLGPTWKPVILTRILHRRMYIITEFLNIQVLFHFLYIFSHTVQKIKVIRDIYVEYAPLIMGLQTNLRRYRYG